MIQACGSQLRAGFGGAYALDYTAVMMVGQARQVDVALLADVLPGCEAAILTGRDDQEDGGDADDDA